MRNLLDLKKIINNCLEKTKNPYDKSMMEIVAFLLDNDWFGVTLTSKDENVFINNKDVDIISNPLTFFLTNPTDSSVLADMLEAKFPETTRFLLKFFGEEQTEESIKFYVMDFMLYYLEKDAFLYNDEQMEKLVEVASMELPKKYGDYLTFFFSWLKMETKTQYYRDYIMNQRYAMTIQNEAYDFEDYLKLFYYLLTPDYIEDNQMYQKAAKSKNFADTWLFLSMHFICSIRYTDMQRIYQPMLPYAPEEVIEKIQNDTFTDNDARYILLTITQRMSVLPLDPNKTSHHSNIPDVKFHVPKSCEVHFGKLFALAEAHRQLNGNTNEPLIRKIATHKEIERYMGEEIGDLFLEADFHSRSATKSYLQMLYQYTDDVLCEDSEGISFKGYLIASFARSHKGNFNQFAETTFEYLKDAKLNGLTPEFVAFELLERGVLSCITSMLLNIVTNKEYSKANVKNQTELTKKLNLSPNEVEKVVSLVDQAREQALLVINETIQTEESILTILHRIGCGEAFSKDSDSLCLLTAIHKVCPFERRQCVGCKFEISTYSTFYHLIEEFNRNYYTHQTSENAFKKQKAKYLLSNFVIPKLEEMLIEIKNNYGEETFKQYEELLKENT